MERLKPGTKVQILNNCLLLQFKKGDILTIGEFDTKHNKQCFQEKYEDNYKWLDPNYDKFRIINLEIFETLGD